MKDNKGGILQSSEIEDTVRSMDSWSQDGGEMMELTLGYFQVEGSQLDEGCEDGLSLSRRSVLTEKLLPARWTPVARKRARRGPAQGPSFGSSLPV
jgi:hypothetical protein